MSALAPSSGHAPHRLAAWWQRLSAARQDRLASLVPLVAVLLFLIAVVAAISYLRIQENLSQQQAMRRDADFSIQRVSVHLEQRLEVLQKLARELQPGGAAPAQFLQVSRKFVSDHPETRNMAWLDAQGVVLAMHDALDSPYAPEQGKHPPLAAPEHDLLQAATARQQPIYGLILSAEYDEPYLGLALPLVQKGKPAGALYARYSLTSLLYYGIPAEIYARYAVALTSAQDNKILAGQQATPENPARPQWWRRWVEHAGEAIQLPLPIAGGEILLQLQGYGSASQWVNRSLFLLVLALSGLTTWMLLVNWQYLLRRQRSQQALLAETSFRRAMENSLVTGMRALDLDGRISHVNAAFCQMTGWSDAELVGQLPPYTFWHKDDHERHQRILEKTLSDKMAQGGYEMRVLRKNGSTFEARMYMSPLIGADGVQTGWVSSMTDITEPNRIKRQLGSAQARFARVLDALDASVSVASLGSKELLFANKVYRQWFGDDLAAAHLRLLAQAGSAATPAIDAAEDEDALAGLPSTELHKSSSNTEIFVPQLQKWLEVRSRYLDWVDGRLAQLVIATDITARRSAEELSAQHEARAQSASRLVTMGEMASSVAHELNQPLTAINNYCNGMVNRIRNGQMDDATMLDALEKTSRQAQRAGQVIQRIRNFVKRSTPNYAPSDVNSMVADAVELAEIEMRRRQVRLQHHAAPDLPRLMVDKILIEQVLVNLMKNAAEAIDQSHMPTPRREVRLEVRHGQFEGRPVVGFHIQDKGPGLSPETLQHLFEAFYTTKSEGMGIGLNLCRSIVEAHQGRLHAENLYNGGDVAGCRFSFWLPVTALPAPVATQDPPHHEPDS